jgi:lambda family phage portal protein
MPADAPPLTRLDRLIGWLSPTRGFRRARARVALTAVRDYEGAARTKRTDGWHVPGGTSATTELAASLPTLRDRSRDHVRNNPYGRRAVRALTSSLVGYGMAGTVMGDNRPTVDRLQDWWDEWADGTGCDQRGRQTFGGLQRLAARTLCESGEVLVQRVWDPESPTGFRVLILEPDYLDSYQTQIPRTLANGHRIVAGVELDAHDRPAAYWLLPSHPGDAFVWGAALAEPNRVPAADVAHVFDEERAGQGRGCPLLAAVLVPLRDLDECKDAHQVRQKIAACFAAFYSTPDGATRSRKDPLVDHVEPGMVEELPPGYEVTFGNPPGVEGYADVMRIGLQAVAAGTGVPYEELSGDYSQFNFSAGRMSRGSYFAMVDELQWQVLIPGFHDRVFSWFLDAARIRGVDTAGISITWTPPRRPLVDPAREIGPAIEAVRATLSSPQEAIRELGYDPETVLREWQTFTTWLDDLGLVSDLDPRRTTNGGGRVTPPPDDGTTPPPPTGRQRRPATHAGNGVAPH